MKRISIKAVFILTLAFSGLGLLGFSQNVAVASPADDACEGLKLVDASASCSPSGSADNSGLKKIITTIVNTLSVIVGAVAVIMIIIGGFRYIVSGGDSNGISGAKNTILYAIVGLVVVLFAQVIVAFVYKSATTSPGSGSGSSQGEDGTNGSDKGSGNSNGGSKEEAPAVPAE